MWPTQPRLNASLPALADENFTRRSAAQHRMRSMVVEPGRVAAKLDEHATESHRNEQKPEALLFHRTDEAFDNGEAGRLTEESESTTYNASSAPPFVRPTRELTALVGHDAPSQDLRQLLVSQRREQPLQLPDEVPDKVRVAIDRLDGLNESSCPVLIEPPHPDQERLQIDEKDLRGPLQGPAASGAELQDPHPLSGQIVRPSPGAGPFPAAILNSEFLAEEGDLGRRLLELDSEPSVRVCATTGM
jgi:hypothetical protein